MALPHPVGMLLAVLEELEVLVEPLLLLLAPLVVAPVAPVALPAVALVAPVPEGLLEALVVVVVLLARRQALLDPQKSQISTS